MEKEGRWMVIRRTSGRVVELSTVYVSATTKPRRNRRKGTTTAQKQDENERDCVKRLARTLNCNFSYGDLLLTAKYDAAGIARLEAWAREHQREGQSWEDAMVEAAQREGENYLRRIMRALKLQGETVKKYVLVTSDMNGETGERVRIHNHLVLPRVTFELAAKLWKLGTVDYQTLHDQDDYTPLAEYLCRQVRRRPGKKKFTCARNMEKPVVNERWAKPGEELRADRGGKLMHRNEWEPGRPQYIRFVKKREGERSSGDGPERGKEGVFGHGKAGVYAGAARAGTSERGKGGSMPGGGGTS